MFEMLVTAGVLLLIAVVILVQIVLMVVVPLVFLSYFTAAVVIPAPVVPADTPSDHEHDATGPDR